jgi:hypothetical protein
MCHLQFAILPPIIASSKSPNTSARHCSGLLTVCAGILKKSKASSILSLDAHVYLFIRVYIAPRAKNENPPRGDNLIVEPKIKIP